MEGHAGNRAGVGKSGASAPKLALGAGFLACALCCSAPMLIGLGVGGSALAAFAVHAETIAGALLALAVVSYLVLRYRNKREGATCAVDPS